MADTELDSQSGGDEPPAGEQDSAFTLAPERAVTPARTDMTVQEMRDWLRNWIANATGQSADTVAADLRRRRVLTAPEAMASGLGDEIQRRRRAV